MSARSAPLRDLDRCPILTAAWSRAACSAPDAACLGSFDPPTKIPQSRRLPPTPLGPRRHIELLSSVAIDPSTPGGAVTINRIVEVRACHGGADGHDGLYQIDWGNTQARGGPAGVPSCQGQAP